MVDKTTKPDEFTLEWDLNPETETREMECSDAYSVRCCIDDLVKYGYKKFVVTKK